MLDFKKEMNKRDPLMYQLFFYCPHTHTEQVKTAVFLTGAGRIGNYNSCSWQVAGSGQFRPLAGSDAFIGEKDILETVQEDRVEMICLDQHIDQAVMALKESHPYEEVAYGVIKLEDK